MDIDHIYETLKIGAMPWPLVRAPFRSPSHETWMAIHALEENDFPLYVRDEFRKVSDALTTTQQSAIDAHPEGRMVDRARAACEALDDERA